MGSAPDAVVVRELEPQVFDARVAINNAWRLRKDWTHLIHPEDFPQTRQPDVVGEGQRIVDYKQYVPANNAYGGVIYAGGTMAFTAGYWALRTFGPAALFFVGCDMVYDTKSKQTHFYGTGEADPLRVDPTLQSLQAKSNRLLVCALKQDSVCINLSQLPSSRLTFPRMDPRNDLIGSDEVLASLRAAATATADLRRVDMAFMKEKEVGCFAESGNYWEEGVPEAQPLKQIDDLWLNTIHGADLLSSG